MSKEQPCCPHHYRICLVEPEQACLRKAPYHWSRTLIRHSHAHCTVIQMFMMLFCGSFWVNFCSCIFYFTLFRFIQSFILKLTLQITSATPAIIWFVARTPLFTVPILSRGQCPVVHRGCTCTCCTPWLIGTFLCALIVCLPQIIEWPSTPN